MADRQRMFVFSSDPPLSLPTNNSSHEESNNRSRNECLDRMFPAQAHDFVTHISERVLPEIGCCGLHAICQAVTGFRCRPDPFMQTRRRPVQALGCVFALALRGLRHRASELGSFFLNFGSDVCRPISKIIYSFRSFAGSHPFIIGISVTTAHSCLLLRITMTLTADTIMQLDDH